MWRSKKLIVGVVLAAVLLAGSLGGVALANGVNEDDSQPRAEFLDRLAGKLGITVEELQAKIAEVRGELPKRDGESWNGGRGPAGCFGNPGGMLGIEIDEDAWKAAMAEAKERIQAGDDMQEVMAEVLESFGIDVEELKAACAEARKAHREMLGEKSEAGFFGPGFGFKGRGGPCDMGGMRGFGGWCAPMK